jgi:hypothetical protein
MKTAANWAILLKTTTLWNPWTRLRVKCCANKCKMPWLPYLNVERQVLELRFGTGGRQRSHLEEVSRYFNVTRERIRQIEAKALRKLRHPTRSRYLKEYLS